MNHVIVAESVEVLGGDARLDIRCNKIENFRG
jgi:hypothetical protein